MQIKLRGNRFKASVAYSALIIVVISCSSGNLYNIYDVSGFGSGAGHWWRIKDEVRIINPLPDQKRYDVSDIKEIAENILTYQRVNGGWPQFFPDTNGYAKYITFNDGAMIGVMNVLENIN